jgi:hypothetical protein
MIKNKKYKILVTGGSGFIGTNLVNELRNRGQAVIVYDLLNHELPDYIRCDVRNYRHIERVFDKFGPFEFQYHLAAEYGRWNGEDYYENFQPFPFNYTSAETLDNPGHFKFIELQLRYNKLKINYNTKVVNIMKPEMA